MGRREKSLDAAAGPVAEFALALRRLRQAAGSPTYAEMADRPGSYSVATLSRAAGGEQLPTLPVVLAYVVACGGDEADWQARWHSVVERLYAARAQEENDAACPYRGLSRYEPSDRDVFFGRDRLIDDLVILSREHRIVTVFGPSGSGKSSLLRAGLVPRLQDLDPAPAAIRLLTPGDRSLTRHCHLLVPADAPGDTWLIVDQFEEIFTLCQEGERTSFLNALLAAGVPGARIRVVLGIRADFYPHCLAHAGLAQAVRDASLPITPMTRDELRQVITGPASARTLAVERSLTTRLIDEIHGQDAGLPLLSHSLLETWLRRHGRTLTLDAYERSGGVHGAIARTAEAAYERLDPSQTEIARRILLRLITPGEPGRPDTCRPADRSSLGPVGPVLDELVRARLVTIDADTIALAHESLMTAWPRLHNWIEQDREKLRLRRWLTEAAEAWEAVGRDPGVRISPVRLAQVGIFATAVGRSELTALEVSFLDAGIATHRRTIRSRRRAQAAMSLLTALVLVTGSMAWQQSRTARSTGPVPRLRQPRQRRT
ncbi:helix-turn-helix domain-containing protein [Streptomyces sp. NPDC126499]|uniref:nSTAND1 domain-containing NTPase n=1 Tax=Streptomyces sp. NPDC126499 TaxID=3155314 RepID=UPI00333105E5